MDEWQIDSHKLMFHPERVAAWLNGENIFPIYAEVAPVSYCNHRCNFCAFDYCRNKKYSQIPGRLFLALTQAARGGLKAVMFAGEGEPLLHPKIAQIIKDSKTIGLDIAITTNASLLTPDLAKDILPYLTWLRGSINAGTPETYSRVHRVAAKEFFKVLTNLEEAVKLKNSCTIGAQIVVLSENRSEVQILADRLADIGLDYLIVKPYSQHPRSIVRMNSEPLPEVKSERIKIITRRRAEENLKKDKPYKHCLALPFWSHIDAGGNVWGCSCFLGDERFYYGNINQQHFDAIWGGERRQKSLKWVENEMAIEQCRKACRLDQINEYLWRLKHRELISHINFI